MSHAVSLFDHSGTMLRPWADAGYTCWAVDIDHPVDGTEQDGINLVRHDLSTPWLPPFDRADIRFVAAFPPCTHLAVSGARWFRGKGLRALASSIELFATAAEFCEWASNAKTMIENPVSTISTYWRPPDHHFHPWQYAALQPDENYTKKTCLWTGGGFIMPTPETLDPPGLFGGDIPDNRIWEMGPSEMRSRFRSLTPSGFAQAVFEANHRESG